MDRKRYVTAAYDVKDSSNVSCIPSEICRDDEQSSSLSVCLGKANNADAKSMLPHVWNGHQYVWNCLIQVFVNETLYLHQLHISTVKHLKLKNKKEKLCNESLKPFNINSKSIFLKIMQIKN